MSILWSNNGNSTVSGSLSSTGTSFSVASGTGSLFPTITNVGVDYFMLTFYDQLTKTVTEIVKCTAHAANSDVFTIARAQENTTAKAWNSGDLVANLITAGTLASFVQSGAGPLSTSMIYVGADVSNTPGTIVATTTPIPPSLAVGMQFNIKVANINPGPVTIQLNGAAGAPVTRTDGSPMIGGNLVTGEEMIFICNQITPSVSFTSMVPPIPQAPPQSTFYVNPNGNDSNSGFANTSAAAFKTVSGAMTSIKSRYISQNQITIRVADGTYIDCFGDSGSYIASWNIVGNVNNPGNCVLNATPNSLAGYPPNAVGGGRACEAGPASNITLNGFTFSTLYENVISTGGTLTLINCNFTAPQVSGGFWAISSNGGGEIFVYGNCQYTGAVVATAIFNCTRNSYLRLGYFDQFVSQLLVFNIQGNPVIGNGVCMCDSGGVIIIHNRNNTMTFTGGVPTGPKYNCQTTGGITTDLGNAPSFIPGSMPGTVVSPGWVQ